MSFSNQRYVWAMRFAEGAFCLVLSLCVVSAFLSQFELLPDSSNYITAALNLLHHGQLYVFVNWPSLSMEPVPEIYTEYPPGFPVYLSLFVGLARDPVLGAAMAQSTAIVGLFILTHILTFRLHLHVCCRLASCLSLALFSVYRPVFGILLSEPLFLCLTVGSMICAVSLCQKKQEKHFWILGCILIACSTSVKFVGVFNIAFFLLPLLNAPGRRWLHAVALLGSSLLPVALWFVRNFALTGELTRSHAPDSLVQTGSLMTSLFEFRNTMGMGSAWILLILVGLMLSVSFLPRKTKEYRSGDIIVLGFLAHFVGITLLSVCLRMDYLSHRLLSPSYVIFGIALLTSLNKVASLHPYCRVFLIAPYLYFILNPNFHEAISAPDLTALVRPKEEEVWKMIHQIPELADSTHFYSDYNFTHQIFSGLPQKIVWDPAAFQSTEVITSLGNNGRNPYFVLTSDKDWNAVFSEHSKTLGYRSVQLGSFSLYYRDNLSSGMRDNDSVLSHTAAKSSDQPDAISALNEVNREDSASDSITVISPRLYEVYLAGDAIPIQWISGGVSESNVRLLLFRGGFFAGSEITIPNVDGINIYRWVIPQGLPTGNNYRIRVYSNETINCYSPDFTIDGSGPVCDGTATITVTSPASGSEWLGGESSIPIKWTTTGASTANVLILLYRGEYWVHGVKLAVTNTCGENTYNWPIPRDLDSGTDYRFRIQAQTGISGFSGFFTVIQRHE